MAYMQEINSFLKGSAEAMESPDGKLSLEQYLEVLHQITYVCQVATCTDIVIELCLG